MSEFLKTFLLAKKNYKKAKITMKINQRPAGKNINYSFIDSISYNIIENTTMFKNNEINKNLLNLGLLCNLSYILTKEEIDKKEVKILKRKKKNNEDNKECTVQNFGIYFPTSRITCLEEKKIKNKISSNGSQRKSNKNGINLKIPFTREVIRTFFPLGRSFLEIKNKSHSANNDGVNDKSFDAMFKENSSYVESNDNDNSFSLLSEESFLSNKDSNNINNKGFRDLKKFKKYTQLIDYIECPLIKNNSTKEKYNNFIQLLKNFDELLDENNFINYNINKIKENNILNENINNNNYNKVYIDDFEIINSFNKLNIEPIKIQNYSTSAIYDIKKNKVSDISKNDLNEKNENSSSIYNLPNQSKNKILNNINDKSLEISSPLKKKYLKRMNENYISLIHNNYMDFITKCKLAKGIFFDDIMIKKLFVQLFKSLLLEFGIIKKKVYEKILKNQIFSNKLLSFDQFIQCFDAIIYDNENENLKTKFIFLFNILPHNNDNDFLNSKKIELYFDLLGCSSIYIQDFCEELGERLVIRFNAVYKIDEEDNVLLGKYRFRKMKIILESFLDALQIDD